MVFVLVACTEPVPSHQRLLSLLRFKKMVKPSPDLLGGSWYDHQVKIASGYPNFRSNAMSRVKNTAVIRRAGCSSST
jgi:hypothetical protein